MSYNYFRAFETACQQAYGSMTTKPNLNLKDVGKVIVDAVDPAIRQAVEKAISCFDSNCIVYQWDLHTQSLVEKKMRDITNGDLLLVANLDETGTHRFELEPAICVNRYEKKPYSYLSFLKIDLSDASSIVIHQDHYMHFFREGQYIFGLAKEVQEGDEVIKVSPIEDIKFSKLRIAKVTSASADDLNSPINIRTTNLNLIVNGIWSSGQFSPDAGYIGHAFVKVAFKIHTKGGQLLHDLTQSLNLDKLLH